MRYSVSYSILSQRTRDPIGGGSRTLEAPDPDAAYRAAYAVIRAEVDCYAPRALVSIADVTAEDEYRHGGARHLCNALSPCA